MPSRRIYGMLIKFCNVRGETNHGLHNATTARRLLIQHAYRRVWLYTTPGGVDGATVIAVGQPAKVARVAAEWASKQRTR
jgi:hypothetical protein